MIGKSIEIVQQKKRHLSADYSRTAGCFNKQCFALLRHMGIYIFERLQIAIPGIASTAMS